MSLRRNPRRSTRRDQAKSTKSEKVVTTRKGRYPKRDVPDEPSDWTDGGLSDSDVDLSLFIKSTPKVTKRHTKDFWVKHTMRGAFHKEDTALMAEMAGQSVGAETSRAGPPDGKAPDASPPGTAVPSPTGTARGSPIGSPRGSPSPTHPAPAQQKAAGEASALPLSGYTRRLRQTSFLYAASLSSSSSDDLVTNWSCSEHSKISGIGSSDSDVEFDNASGVVDPDGASTPVGLFEDEDEVEPAEKTKGIEGEHGSADKDASDKEAFDDKASESTAGQSEHVDEAPKVKTVEKLSAGKDMPDNKASEENASPATHVEQTPEHEAMEEQVQDRTTASPKSGNKAAKEQALQPGWQQRHYGVAQIVEQRLGHDIGVVWQAPGIGRAGGRRQNAQVSQDACQGRRNESSVGRQDWTASHQGL